MEEVWNPHDRLFKEIWSEREAAADFLSRYLPEDVSGLLAPESVELCKDSFVTADLREYFSDLLYRVSIGGRNGYLYVLLEHKTWPAPLTPFQLLGYIKGIWDLHLKQGKLPLPVVIPVVLYHGRDAWHAPDSLLGLLEDPAPELRLYVPDFHYHLIDLSNYGDEEIKGHVLIRAGMLLFKYVFRPDYAKRIPGILRLLRELVEKETGMQYIEGVLRYIFSTVEDMGVEELKPIVSENLSKQKGDWIMTLAERIKKEGVEQGIQQGLLEGIAALLEIKFGQSGLKLLPGISKIEDTPRLRQMKEIIKASREVQEVEKAVYH